MHGDWVVAIASLLTAIIGVLGGYLLARYQREKRILRFSILDTEDLAVTLRQHGNFEIKFKDFSTTELILSTIVVSNVGNCSIRNIEFSLKIPGEHSFSLITCVSRDPALAKQVSVLSPAVGDSSIDRVFPASLPFFNADEHFRINVLYNGAPSQCEVTCRMADTTVQIYTLPELERMHSRRNRWKLLFTLLATIVVWSVLTFGAYLLKTLFQATGAPS